jgi:phenol 2-monooxygenase
MPESLKIDIEAVGDDNAYPVTVTLRHLPKAQDATLAYPTKISNGLHRSNLTADNTETVLLAAKTSEVSCTETVHAKYVVGCDGAHSWTRRQIGSVMEGEQSDYVWFVFFFRMHCRYENR